MEALALHHAQYLQDSMVGETIQERLRKQMQADALSASPVSDEVGEVGEGSTQVATSEKEKKKLVELNQEYDPDFLEEAVQFLRLQVCLLFSINHRRSPVADMERNPATRPSISGTFISPDNLCLLFLLWD